MTTEPKIFTKNYVHADNVFTLSHGQDRKASLYDGDKNSRFISVGAAQDTTALDIQVEFREGSAPIHRTIDTLILVNHNLKDWTLFHWNGSGWEAVTAMTGDAASTTFKSFTTVTTPKVRLSATATQAPNQEKVLGELIVCALLLDIGADPHTYETPFREKRRELVLADGSLHVVNTRFSPTRLQKYGAKASFRFVPQSVHDQLLAVKESGVPFLWYPESLTRPDEIYLVHWTNPWNAKYATSYKGTGYVITLELKEV